MQIKTGIGYDIHRLEQGRKLYLGGVEIPYAKGLLGHSDGDCLIHAIIDSLLGAMGEKDIGQFFPDTNPVYKDMRSTKILASIVSRLNKMDFKISNIDSIIIAEDPKLAKFIPQMKHTLSSILDIKINDLGIKAKSNEGIDEIGKGNAISAWATALLITGSDQES